MYFLEQLKSMIYVVPVVLAAITIHEFAHGFVSDRLGDPTPRREGRLSLNPFRHLDLWGTICLLLFHMGWAKPVRIHTGYYKNRKTGTILVSLAGPAANFIFAFLSILLLGLIEKFGGRSSVWSLLQNLCYYSGVLNIGLGLFNLIPLPPLDGSNVLAEIFPGVQKLYVKIRPYSSIILLALVWLGVLGTPLAAANNSIINAMWRVVVRMLNLIPVSGVI